MLTLADTGLRVHEACKLQRGQVDWNEGRAVIVGKGNKQAVVRFSTPFAARAQGLPGGAFRRWMARPERP